MNFIFYRYHHSLVVVTPAKYECDSIDLTDTKHEMTVTGKLTSGSKVTPTPIPNKSTHTQRTSFTDGLADLHWGLSMDKWLHPRKPWNVITYPCISVQYDCKRGPGWNTSCTAPPSYCVKRMLNGPLMDTKTLLTLNAFDTFCTIKGVKRR